MNYSYNYNRFQPTIIIFSIPTKKKKKPQSSLAARVVAVVSILFIVLSTIALTLNTLPSLQEKVDDHVTGENVQLSLVETICISWFTLEFTARLISAPKKKKFLKGKAN